MERLARRRRRIWRRTRRAVRWSVGTPLVLGLAALAVSRSPLVGVVLRGQVERLLGVQLEHRGAIIELDGRLVVHGLRLKAPDVNGEAGQVLTADSAVVELDWSDVFSARVMPVAVRLDGATLVLSQSLADQSLNIGAIAGRAGVGGTPVVPPEITISSGELVIAEHDALGKLSELRRVGMRGVLLPIRGGQPVFSVAVTEVGAPNQTDGARPGRRGLVLSGRVNLTDGSSQVQLRNLSLDDWPPERVPSAYREVWRRLNIRGGVPRLDVVSTRVGGVSVEVALRDVSMSALVPSDADTPTFVGPVRDLQLLGVNGSVRIGRDGVRAELEGRVEGQESPSRVRLRTQGLELISPLTCDIRATGVKFTKDPSFLAYVPATVREYLDYFSGPTGDVDMVAVIARGSPTEGRAGPIRVEGTMTFRNGTAAFHKFPYPFTDMSGIVRFDDTRLIFENLRGRGPTGATLSARGVVSPLTPDARVDVLVDVRGLPIDDHLLAAMPEDRRNATRSIADRDVYERMLTDGLIRRPGELASDGTRSAPPFPLAGDADVSVRVERESGPEDVWTTTIDASFSQIGVLNPTFPLPIIGRDVRLRITDDDVRLLSGRFVGLRSGRVDVDAGVTFFRKGKRVFEPRLEVIASKLPVDDLLLSAIRAAPSKPTPEVQGAPLFVGALDRLDLAGTIDCHALVTGEPQPDGADAPLQHVVTVDLAGLTALIGAANAADERARTPRVALTDFLGTLRLSRESVRVEGLQARLVRATASVGPRQPSEIVGPLLPAADADAGLIGVDLSVALEASDQPGALDARLSVAGLDLRDPVEQVVGVLSPEAAGWVAQRRAERAPAGSIDLEVRAQRAQGDSGETMPNLSARITRAHDVSVSALGGRLTVDGDSGEVAVLAPAGGDLALEASAFRAGLAFDNDPVGRLAFDGRVTVDADSGRVVTPASAAAGIDGCRFEAPIVLAALAALGGDAATSRYSQFAPQGRFDALFRLSGASAPPGREPGVSGIISPRELSIERDGRRVRFDRVEGQVEFESGVGDASAPARTTGRVLDLGLETAAWRATLDGVFDLPGAGVEVAPGSPDQPAALNLGLRLEADRMDEDLTALLPAATRNSIEELGLKINGPIEVLDARLISRPGPDGNADHSDTPVFQGEIDFSDASLTLGLPIDGVTGRLVVNPQGAHNAGDVESLQLQAQRLWVRGVALSDLRLRARSAGDGEVVLDDLRATCHGGRLVGSGSVRPLRTDGAIREGDAAQDPEKMYRLEVSASGVAFASLLDDLKVASEPQPFVGPRQDVRLSEDLSRGRMDVRLGISGVSGDEGSRVGSGAVRVQDGDVLSLPLLFPLMQISNLVLPGDDRLRWAEAEFHLTGNRATFERVIASGESIALHGTGTIELPDGGLDFTFNSRSTRRLPLLSWLWETIRDEIVTTRITGMLSEPKISSRSLSGFQRLVWSLFGRETGGAGASAEPPAPSQAAGASSGLVRLERGGGRAAAAVEPISESGADGARRRAD